MAIINYSPWQDAANFGQGLGASLTNLLIELPRIRQQQALLAAHQQLYQHQAGLYDAEAARAKAQVPVYGAETKYHEAQAGLLGSQKGEIDDEIRAKERIGNILEQVPGVLASGGSIEPHMAVVLREMPKLKGEDRRSLGESLAQFLEMSNPKFRTALGLGAKTLTPTVNVPAGSTLVNPEAPETPLYQSPRTLGYGQGIYSPQSGENIALGPNRPFQSQNFGAVFGTGYRPVVEEGASPTNAAQNVIDYLQSIQGGLGMKMPTNGLPIIPGRSTNVSPKVRRYNPATGRLEP